MAAMYGEKVRSECRAFLIHDEMSRNQPLCGRVHRQSQALQGVGSQQGGGVVLSKHHQGDLAGAVDRGPDPPDVHLDPPTVGQQEGALSILSTPSSRSRRAGNVV